MLMTLRQTTKLTLRDLIEGFQIGPVLFQLSEDLAYGTVTESNSALEQEFRDTGPSWLLTGR